MDYIIFNVSKVDLLSTFHRQAVTKVQSNRTKIGNTKGLMLIKLEIKNTHTCGALEEHSAKLLCRKRDVLEITS